MTTRVLVLEDDPEMLEVVTEVLVEEGFAVDGCLNADDAVRLARHQAYDLMIADIRMKGLDGLGALSQVQSYQPDIGSLVITGYADEAQGRRARRLGLEGFLEKPFELEQLLDTVRELLAQRTDRISRRQSLESLYAGHRFGCQSLGMLLNPAVREVDFVQLCERAGRLANRLGLEGHRCEEMRLATLLGAARRFLPAEVDDSLPQPPPRIALLLGQSKSLEARTLQLLLDTALDEDPPENGGDQRLVRALRQVWEAPESASEDSERLQDNPNRLFSLAQTLVEAGDLMAARQAFQELVNHDSSSPKGIRALLELARIQQRLGDAEQAQILARRVPELADQVGPLTAASAYLETALMLAEFGDLRWPRELVAQAHEIFVDLGLSGEAACCALAALRFERLPLSDPEHLAWLEVVLQPTRRPLLARALPWLLPLLLRSLAIHEALARPLGRLMTQYPGALVEVLARVGLEARVAALTVALELGDRAPAEVVECLASDIDTQVRIQAAKLQRPSSNSSYSSVLSISTCGRFEVLLGERRVPDSTWKTSKVRYLLACLAAAGSRGVAEDRLLEEFWPKDMERSRKNLYSTTSYVRSALRSVSDSKRDFVIRTPLGLALDPELEVWHDLGQIRRLVAQAREALGKAQKREAAVLYGQVLHLAAGSYLEDCYMTWALRIRQEVEEAVVEAVLASTEVALAESRFPQVIEFCQQALRLDPCLQEAHLRIMKAQIQRGRPEEAVRQHEVCKNALARELQLEPGIEIERLGLEARLLL